MTYKKFLETKIAVAPATGFRIHAEDVNPILKPHQRDAVIWSIAGGRRALFEKFGLGKTLQELEYCRIVTEKIGGQALIVLPLGVRQEFTRDAVQLLGWEEPPPYVRTMAEAKACKHRIMLTNYERVRDGDIDPAYFTACCLDEAAVLRSFGSKIYQEFLPKFAGVAYKLVATAVPSPNRYKELIHYAGFLEVMDTGQALTRFFQRDSTKANNLNLYPHMEEQFWIWVSSWALFLTKPSDLGYSDEGYDLPPLKVNYHKIAGTGEMTEDKDGQIKMFREASSSLPDAAAEKSGSIAARVNLAREIVDSAPGEHFILWHDLEDERRALEKAFPSYDYGNWLQYKDGNTDGLALYERHYSAYQYKDGRERKLFCGPGEKTVLLNRERNALFVWRRFIDESGQKGINCAVFRNESKTRSSELIREAMAIAWLRWPGERLYTYVDAGKVKSQNPGYCFKMAGWKKCGMTMGGLVILEALSGCEIPQIRPSMALTSIYGSLDLDERERRIIDFSEGRSRLLATKKSLSGSGCNFQHHCHRAIFIGIDHKFHDFIQAIHRIYRFLQKEPVEIDIIYTEAEAEILQKLKEKWKRHDEMAVKMRDIIIKYGMVESAMQALTRKMGVDRVEVKGNFYTAVNNDCVLEFEKLPDNCFDLLHTSIPFGNHYEYTPTYNDFGHNEDTARFLEQMDFLSPNLLRTLKPGRVYACHVKDRVLFGNATGTGMPTMEPFHALCIDHYIKHGFQYFGMITVVTDVVRENSQTYRLGWTEQCKDGTKMGVGCPEYILLFRKLPSDTSTAYADVPVSKSKEEYTRAQWQIDAHGFHRSSGNRLISKKELESTPVKRLQAVYRQYSRDTVYDYHEHVELAKALDTDGRLPASFMVVAPGSWSTDVWDDINRMRTLNTTQSQRRQNMHVCPLQLDIVERIINRYSNPGELVGDPFAGLMTVPYTAVKMNRRGWGCELNPDYFRDGVGYLEGAEAKRDMPTLFDFVKGA